MTPTTATTPGPPKRVMIIAGETSGDQHGARLVRAVRALDAAVAFHGIGGPAMKRAGVKIFTPSSALSVVGITEALARLPALAKGLAAAKKALRRLRPSLLILIDFPDFNLNVAAAAKKAGIPVLYYISPQIWAWRPGRVRKIGARIDHMAVILPFEEGFYRRHRIPVTFVGHPLMDDPAPEKPHSRAEGKPAGTVLGLLPGSREREIRNHLPLMLQSARLLLRRRPDLAFVVSLAPAVDRAMVQRMLDASGIRDRVDLCDPPVEAVFDRCRLVVAVSGTVTLEAAIAETPMVIIYRVSPLSYRLARALVRVPHVGLVNLIAGREVVPELLQMDATPERIARTVDGMLADGRRLQRMRLRMRAVARRLGGPGASRRVAGIALRMMSAP